METAKFDEKKGFLDFLAVSELSENTMTSYWNTVLQYKKLFGTIDRKNIYSYKGYLVENYKEKTVNLRIQALNKYPEFSNCPDLKLKFVKVQQKNFLENVISDADYRYFIACLKRDKRWNWYFVVRFLCATGARISELVQIKVEDVQAGYVDIYGKGHKLRRLYIPCKLVREASQWLKKNNNESGFVFLNRYHEPISPRGVANQLKVFAREYKINPQVVYPHSFRHRFAKNFLEKFSDLALLADLMGHESIETTRIYLRRTSSEQKKIVDNVVTW